MIGEAITRGAMNTKRATYSVSSLGVIVHLYMVVKRATASDLNMLITPVLNILPYLICLIILRYSSKSFMALCSSSLFLIADIYLYSDFLFSNKVFGFNLIGIFTPFWKIGICLPIGCCIGLMIDKYVKPRSQ
jgi:hypothetical protein